MIKLSNRRCSFDGVKVHRMCTGRSSGVTLAIARRSIYSQSTVRVYLVTSVKRADSNGSHECALESLIDDVLPGPDVQADKSW